jgi:hypothetical protein
LRASSRRDLRVFGRLEPDLRDVHRVMATGVTQDRGSCKREHLVD